MPYEIREERLFPGHVCFVRPLVCLSLTYVSTLYRRIGIFLSLDVGDIDLQLLDSFNFQTYSFIIIKITLLRPLMQFPTCP
jgi:hypothetical protein